MTRSKLFGIVLTALLAGAIGGFALGWRHRQFDLALQENKIAAANLRANRDVFGGTNLPPVFREYLKARIYCNVRHHYPSRAGYLLRKDWDFGPVDRGLLGTISVWKDPDGKVWDWESAVRGK